MNFHIEKLLEANRSWIVITFATLLLFGSMIFLFNDIEKSIYVLIGVFSGSLLFFVNPFFTLLLIILINHFDELLQLPMSLTAGRILGLVVAIGWIFRYFFSKKTKLFQLVDLNRILIIFIVLIIISSLLASDPVVSIKTAFTISLLILMVFFIQDFVSDMKKLDLLIIIIAISVGIGSLVGIVQYKSWINSSQVIGTVYNESGTMRYSGVQGNPNGYGAFLMYGIPFLLFLIFNSKNLFFKLISLIFFSTCVISLGLTVSRTHIIGFIFFILIYAVLNFKFGLFNKRAFLILIVILAILFLVMSYFLLDIVAARADLSSDVRYSIMMKGIELLKANPFFGVGFENFQLIPVEKYEYLHNRPGHDLISKIFVSIGLMGSSLWLYLCYKTLKYFNTSSKRFRYKKDRYLLSLVVTIESAFLAQLATWFGNTIIFSRIFWIYIALAIVLYRYSQVEAVQESLTINNSHCALPINSR